MLFLQISLRRARLVAIFAVFLQKLAVFEADLVF